MIGDLYPGGARGWIEVICGVMFSGKSEELIRRVRRALIAKKRVQVFKSHLDERYAGIYHVSSHDGRSVEAVPIDTPEQIARTVLADTHVVAIDEAQFLPAGIVDLATTLASSGKRVILAGTDTDFRGEPFGCMPQLLAVAVHTPSFACASARNSSRVRASSLNTPRSAEVIVREFCFSTPRIIMQRW